MSPLPVLTGTHTSSSSSEFETLTDGDTAAWVVPVLDPAETHSAAVYERHASGT